MKQLTALRMFLLCVLTMSFASCSDDVFYIMANQDKDLCNKLWVTYYETEEGLTGSYQLRFFIDGKGQEVTTLPVSGGTNTTDKEINWRWTDESKECLQWTYTDGTSKYLNNVWVRQHYLSGALDGVQMVFVESGYQH